MSFIVWIKNHALFSTLAIVFIIVALLVSVSVLPDVGTGISVVGFLWIIIIPIWLIVKLFMRLYKRKHEVNNGR